MILHPNSVVPNDMILKPFIVAWMFLTVVASYLFLAWIRAQQSEDRRNNGWSALGAAGLGIVSLLIGDWLS